MQTMDWLWSHIGSMDRAVALLRAFCWSLELVERDGVWYVTDGDRIIFSAESRPAVDAFLYGMALSLSCIPEPIFSRLAADIQEWCDTR